MSTKANQPTINEADKQQYLAQAISINNLLGQSATGDEAKVHQVLTDLLERVAA